MGYLINPTAFSAVFTVPCAVVDEHLKLAGAAQLKVLLYLLRNLSSGIVAAPAAAALGLPESEVEDAFLYWSQAGLLQSETPPAAAAADEPPKPRRAARPTREDVAARGSEDEKIRYLMQGAQMKFGRSLKSTEAATLLWLCDDLGMSISVILLLLQYAVSEKRCNISFIEKTALDWVENGVQDVRDAELRIASAAERKAAWGTVQRAFGIERRQPSAKELELSAKWVNEWQFSPEMLRCAYDTCVDSKSRLSVPYVAKILENWHKNGYSRPEDVRKAEQERQNTAKGSMEAAYDLDLFEKKLYSDDD